MAIDAPMAPLPSLWLLACRAPHDVSHLPETAVPAPAADAGPLVRELASARIAAVGDLLMHGMVQRSATEAEAGFDALWADVTPRLLEADLAFANLETPIAPKNGKGVRPMVFNAPPTLLDSLVGSGFDVVSFANNHVYDQGRAGLTETVQILDEHPIAFVGAGTTCAEARAARLLDAGEIKVGFLGATDLYNDDLNAGEEEACTFTFDVETVVAAAAAARQAGAELVIVSVRRVRHGAPATPRRGRPRADRGRRRRRPGPPPARAPAHRGRAGVRRAARARRVQPGQLRQQPERLVRPGPAQARGG